MPPSLPLLFLRRHRLYIRLRLLSTTAAASSPPPPLEVTLSHPIYMLWGSNTGVGKTLVSAGLAVSSLSSSDPPNPPPKFVYIKPVQTGFPRDSDSRFVHRKVSEIFLRRRTPLPLLASDHALRASGPAAGEVPGGGAGDAEAERSCVMEGGWKDLWSYVERLVPGTESETGGSSSNAAELVCKTIYTWKEAVSPHLAAEREGANVSDPSLRESLGRCLEACLKGRDRTMCVVETAGGVASPGPSGTLQCDLYRPFRLPAVLVGDGRLGGISGTISAYESLKLRGYDVVAVILEDHGLLNEAALLSYLRNRVQVLVLPPVPQDLSDDLMEWFHDSDKVFSFLREIMLAAFAERIKRLHDMPRKARNVFWWPFTQHGLIPQENVTVIDSRLGENFSILKVHSNQRDQLIAPQFDACASWWTQGPDAALQIELARDMGYAAARFGHVMFPENVYEPALKCGELLLEGVGKGWASRTFFSDNGSTAIEIALKMAFRKFSLDHGILKDLTIDDFVERSLDIKVLALSGSYHGDTLGAMEAQAPSSYTGFLQQPWYRGRGLFLDPPTVFIHNGDWNISFPKPLQSDVLKIETMTVSSCDDLFSQTRDSSDLARYYSAHISQKLFQLEEPRESVYIGALIIEPVIHGAGGMHMVDPLFQRILVKECQNRKIPVVFDEVFTGFWRIGRESAAELLGCLPDIACFAKLMTGGIIPLAATLATEAVFKAFEGDSKLMALLHGHSYSAHAMGCTAAVKAIQWFKDRHTNPNIVHEKQCLKELWDPELVRQVSSHSAVQRVVALGTLCAIELKANGCDSGYASIYLSSLVHRLREDGVYMRPLGNVIYLMCGPCISPQVCNQQLEKVYQRIHEFSTETAKHTEFVSLPE
ncbi:hypothetical protein QJS10_CPB18g00222 [Acorus calamus]|uniref:Bifunctional dethiobiotin synthetase/7,8-diamino-pelargonic acid aminotransferase, mitochondrial n=1 Tax=Acorus calamus TaxID=4465 RepID=A0AAV9CPX6_ACOCL|nr:hypothetical protein QJS10_CPB18g00222 [Acorus calamus]